MRGTAAKERKKRPRRHGKKSRESVRVNCLSCSDMVPGKVFMISFEVSKYIFVDDE